MDAQHAGLRRFAEKRTRSPSAGITTTTANIALCRIGLGAEAERRSGTRSTRRWWRLSRSRRRPFPGDQPAPWRPARLRPAVPGGQPRPRDRHHPGHAGPWASCCQEKGAVTSGSRAARRHGWGGAAQCLCGAWWRSGGRTGRSGKVSHSTRWPIGPRLARESLPAELNKPPLVPRSSSATNQPIMHSSGPRRSSRQSQVTRSQGGSYVGWAKGSGRRGLRGGSRSVAPDDLDLGGVELVATLEAGEQDHSLDVGGEEGASPAQAAPLPGGA